MNFNIKVSPEKELWESPQTYTGSKVASGSVEIESALKFSFSVLQTKDHARMFVKFPSVRNRDGTYSNVVFPVDSELRQEIEERILEELKTILLEKQFSTLPIDSVRITVLPENRETGPIAVRGYASMNISGFAINGIVIKESSKGLFVQMPQWKDADGNYHDIVYGTNTYMQKKIKETVLVAYEKEKAGIKKLYIDKEMCTFVESWKNNQTTYTIGQCDKDERFYFARFETDGKVYEDGYDHFPTHEELESDHAKRLMNGMREAPDIKSPKR